MFDLVLIKAQDAQHFLQLPMYLFTGNINASTFRTAVVHIIVLFAFAVAGRHTTAAGATQYSTQREMISWLHFFLSFMFSKQFLHTPELVFGYNRFMNAFC